MDEPVIAPRDADPIDVQGRGSTGMGTLAELLALAALVVVPVGCVMWAARPPFCSCGKPSAARDAANIAAIAAALDEYAILNGGHYPDGLEVLVTPDANGHTFLRARRVPHDRWRRPYRYELLQGDPPRPRVYTLGRDGRPGGSGEDADVDNLETDRP